MSKITEIKVQAKDKERCNIYLDGEFALGVSMETVYTHHLKKGLEIDEQELKSLTNESEKGLALAKAIKYVSKTLKTKKQVLTYLSGKGYTEEICYYVIDKMKEYNLINDVEYCKRYFECRSKTEGRKLADFKLMNKGIKKSDIEKASTEIEIPSKDNAKALAEKYLKNKDKTQENITKAYRYILSRGFSYEDVEYALSEFKD